MIDKNNILSYLILIALASSIASLFAPTTSLSMLDVNEYYEIDDFTHYWEATGSFFYRTVTGYEIRNSDNPTVLYNKLHVLIFEFTGGEHPEQFTSTLTDYYSEENSIISLTFHNLVYLVFFSIATIFFVFYYYKTYQNINYKKSKYSLYCGTILLIALIFNIASTYYYNNFVDRQNRGFIYFTKFEYGFYLMIASIVLFFITYFLQTHLTNHKNEVEKQEL